MNIVNFLFHSAFCLIPLIAITIIVAYVTTQAKLKSAKRILGDVRNGVYDRQTNPSFIMNLRIYAAISLILVILVICFIVWLIAYNVFPLLQQESAINKVAAVAPGVIMALAILSFVLLGIYEVVMRRHNK